MKKLIFLFINIISLHAFGNNVCTTDFLLEEGLVIVKAQIDGQKGFFILDTGAPCLVLNSNRFEVKNSSHQMMSANGAVNTKEKSIKLFKWGCIEKKRFVAKAIDLNHLEQSLKLPILGLIGFEMIQKTEILIDYKNREIEHHPTRNSILHEQHTPDLTIPFQLSAHLPILRAEIENVILNLAFDSASESNMLDQDYKERLSSETDPKLIIFRGADQKDFLVTAVNITSTYIVSETFENMEYLFKDVQNIRDNGHKKFDGLLGHPFIAACGRLSINYKKKEIYVWGRSESFVNN